MGDLEDMTLRVEERAQLRSLLGATAAVWAGAGNTRVEPHRWSAFSGSRSVEYNLILCHADSDGSAISQSVEDITAAGVPSLLMVTGTALAHVQQLIERSWVCVGAVPFMVQELLAGTGAPSLPPGVRQLHGSEIDAARDLIAGVFSLDPDIARVAMPAEVDQTPGQAVWGRYAESDELVACVITVTKEDTLTGWSMATNPDARGRGHARVLVEAVAAHAAAAGCRIILLQASSAGEPLYVKTGFRELERWQQWTRPRWVLGRA